jgi:hypothetical protein
MCAILWSVGAGVVLFLLFGRFNEPSLRDVCNFVECGCGYGVFFPFFSDGLMNRPYVMCAILWSVGAGVQLFLKNV